MAGPTTIGVVIPALDEAAQVAASVASVRDADDVVVVDGGSTDGTPAAAEAAGARVVAGPRGRGAQLAAGASAVRGDWLVFLHADTRLDGSWAGELTGLPPKVVGGAFRFALDSPRPSARLIELGVALRCALFRLPYGDQAIFATREAYEAAGGFESQPLLEDVDFVRRLRRLGPLRFPRSRALTSARRFEERGMLRTMLLNWLIMTLDAAGVSRQRLARLYARRARS